MKRLINFLFMNTFFLAVFIFFGCEQLAEPSLDTNGNSLNKNVATRPFKGTMIYTITSMNDTIWTLSGAGNLTHLGNCTTIETIYFLRGYGEDLLTAADGSHIHLIWNPIEDNAQYDFAWLIDGGTGRFEGVTGSGFCPPVFFQPDGSLGIEYIGTITY